MPTPTIIPVAPTRQPALALALDVSNQDAHRVHNSADLALYELSGALALTERMEGAGADDLSGHAAHLRALTVAAAEALSRLRGAAIAAVNATAGMVNRAG
jgi:hypothetical protein